MAANGVSIAFCEAVEQRAAYYMVCACALTTVVHCLYLQYVDYVIVFNCKIPINYFCFRSALAA